MVTSRLSTFAVGVGCSWRNGAKVVFPLPSSSIPISYRFYSFIHVYCGDWLVLMVHLTRSRIAQEAYLQAHLKGIVQIKLVFGYSCRGYLDDVSWDRKTTHCGWYYSLARILVCINGEKEQSRLLKLWGKDSFRMALRPKCTSFSLFCCWITLSQDRASALLGFSLSICELVIHACLHCTPKTYIPQGRDPLPP